MYTLKCNLGFMLTFIIFLTSITVIFGQETKAAATKSERDTLLELLEGYDPNQWPDEQYGKRTDITAQLFINSFGSLSAANMDYSLDSFLRQRWTDRRLAHNRSKPFITVMEKELRDKIWKPDTFFENVKYAALHDVTMPNVLFRIYKNGDVLYSIRVRLTLACNLKLQQYPLDSQMCHVALASYANTMDVIKYHWSKENPIDITEGLEVGEFDILSNTTIEKTYSYVTGNYSGLHAIFILRRQSGYHVLQTYVPTILIVAISWVSFWLDPNAVPGRVTLGATTLLTLTTLSSGIKHQLPPVSYVKAIDVWIGMCMIMVFGALVEFTFVNWLANKKIPLDQLPPKAKMDGDSSIPKTYIRHARAMDRACRVFFPVFFLLFNLAYWPFYLTQQYNIIT